MSVADEPVTVSEDTTLDDFFRDGKGEPEGDERRNSSSKSDPKEEQNGDRAGEAEGADTRSDKGTVDPFEPTVQWRPSGDTCRVCGETVQRRWADEEDVTDGQGESARTSASVCRNCKDW